jgi:hypothetical protein
MLTFDDTIEIAPDDKSGQNNTTINGYSRCCPITGINISLQKECSHFLSTSGLNWLKQNDPNQFELIKRRFLPRRGFSGQHTKFETNEISHLAKQIRSKYYNKKSVENWVLKEQLSLF